MHISESKTCFNVKSSTYYFLMKTKILADFQICISVPFSSNVFITCMHICDTHRSGFLFDTILRFVQLIFKCLCLCFYLHAYKPLIYLFAFSFVFACFWYTWFHLSLHKTASTGTFDTAFYCCSFEFDVLFH